VILERNTSGKNFSSIGPTEPDFQQIHWSFLAFKGMKIRPPQYKVQDSGWSQIKANVRAQLFIGQNF
jgi:hypothetical protein